MSPRQGCCLCRRVGWRLRPGPHTGPQAAGDRNVLLRAWGPRAAVCACAAAVAMHLPGASPVPWLWRACWRCPGDTWLLAELRGQATFPQPPKRPTSRNSHYSEKAGKSRPPQTCCIQELSNEYRWVVTRSQPKPREASGLCEVRGPPCGPQHTTWGSPHGPTLKWAKSRPTALDFDSLEAHCPLYLQAHEGLQAGLAGA